MDPIEVITPEELQKKLEQGEKLNLIDVREDEEVAQGVIPGAEHIRMGDIPSHVNQLDKNQEYIFVCRSGNRSGMVCEYLQSLGYKAVNLTGGMLEWKGKTK